MEFSRQMHHLNVNFSGLKKINLISIGLVSRLFFSMKIRVGRSFFLGGVVTWSSDLLRLFMYHYTPGIYADGYIAFAFPFVC